MILYREDFRLFWVANLHRFRSKRLYQRRSIFLESILYSILLIPGQIIVQTTAILKAFVSLLSKPFFLEDREWYVQAGAAHVCHAIFLTITIFIDLFELFHAVTFPVVLIFVGCSKKVGLPYCVYQIFQLLNYL